MRIESRLERFTLLPEIGRCFQSGQEEDNGRAIGGNREKPPKLQSFLLDQVLRLFKLLSDLKAICGPSSPLSIEIYRQANLNRLEGKCWAEWLGFAREVATPPPRLADDLATAAVRLRFIQRLASGIS